MLTKEHKVHTATVYCMAHAFRQSPNTLRLSTSKDHILHLFAMSGMTSSRATMSSASDHGVAASSMSLLHSVGSRPPSRYTESLGRELLIYGTLDSMT